MSEEQIAAMVLIYGFGFVVTVLSVDGVTALGRRSFLWPAFWLVLVAKACIDLDREVRR
jgi:hypothetical protein